MPLIGGYEDSLRRLGVQSWQRNKDGNSSYAAPSYHYDMLQVHPKIHFLAWQDPCDSAHLALLKESKARSTDDVRTNATIFLLRLDPAICLRLRMSAATDLIC